MDVSLCVLKHNEDTLELIGYKNFSKDRQVELEVHLQPGKYLVVPRTTGALMTLKNKDLASQPTTPLLNKDGQLSKPLESVVEDIFRKFDLFIGRELSYDEFLNFYAVTNYPPLTPQDFKSKFLDKYCSTKDGLTLRGLKHFFADTLSQGKDADVKGWLNTLGYDDHLFNPESRAFTLTFHGG
jgi:hypothetical protein